MGRSRYLEVGSVRLRLPRKSVAVAFIQHIFASVQDVAADMASGDLEPGHVVAILDSEELQGAALAYCWDRPAVPGLPAVTSADVRDRARLLSIGDQALNALDAAEYDAAELCAPLFSRLCEVAGIGLEARVADTLGNGQTAAQEPESLKPSPPVEPS